MSVETLTLPSAAEQMHSEWEDPRLDFTDTYLRMVADPDLLEQTARLRIPADLEYDTLVGTGLSGTIAVTELARRLGKKYLIVRKPNDGSHSYLKVFGTLGRRWMFVDDLVGSGKTMSRCFDMVNNVSNRFSTEFVGTFLYSDNAFFPAQARVHHSWLNLSQTYQGQYANGDPRSRWDF
ncbi:phosphoribosyl transferase [Mycobacterium phage Anthony]|uniref:Phosphoribosyl transferase n=1 Tax=Mycobacterium phage Anthony TaxID=2599857 RepID=A0A5J6TJ74_9CAUD|nr:phosphoribosyl transferase [Mycobacterium phage Anthony]QFG10438.1 phosphoribosyl transferase [Mycobacterium phage Anthony]